MVRCVLRKTLLATVVGAGIEEIWGEIRGVLGKASYRRRSLIGKNRIKEGSGKHIQVEGKSVQRKLGCSSQLTMALPAQNRPMTSILRMTSKLFRLSSFIH